MSSKPVIVVATGWFVFCPIYLMDGFEGNEGVCPIPRPLCLGWLLDAAIEFQQFRNWLISFFDDEECSCCGFIVYGIRPLSQPKMLFIPSEEA